MAHRPLPVTTVILAGGLGQRIGGNKGLRTLHGRPLISWVLDCVRRDSERVLINVNGVQAAYEHFGYGMVSDLLPGWLGPLAGIHAALHCAQTEFVLAVPCDTPFLPADLLMRLYQAMKTDESQAAVALAGGYRQPAIAMFRRDVLAGLTAFLAADRRKVNDWLDTLRLSEVVFDNVEAFDNINSAEDLASAEQRVLLDASRKRAGELEKKSTGQA